ncbi:8-amino-3,8-dideoxy-manno-octulosonate cytidylyltransferase [Desulfosarcina alkanivorans]|uniref:3-deoxy-manno-octulosonate cytidylyltransferase n=1 Tax=Desulfosarcina alkanivorans TaxID=571177 RepID=A0A5K7YKG9_9BACT|nr:3-deoxy-manno-octulosonate cytidylyltransferase [Desulfosarcina alkanivorans]BBO66794.1 8-amino-3,8-dideoxy-manno-octulosonate cytidylyltransferase [Desulfosarcina alkanivorans]
MQVVVIIPSRYGSSRFDGKPLATICGKPMIQWVYQQATKADCVASVHVATDDPRIRDAVRGFGGNVVMTSSQCRSGTDRVAEAAQRLRLEMTDVVVNIQGDQPMVDPRCFDAVVKPFYEDPSIKMSTLAFAIVDEREITDPKDVKVTFDNNSDALYFSRATIPFGRDGGGGYDVYKHLGVYAYTHEFLNCFRSLAPGRLEEIEKLEQLRAMEHGHRIRVVVTPYDSPEVDLPIDIARVEEKMRAMGACGKSDRNA